MIKKVLLILIILVTCFSAFSQLEKKHIRKGNKEFEKEEFQESEISYLKAIQKKQDSFDAGFNLGDALYKQEKYEEAANQFLNLINKETSKENTAKLFHNIGNSFLQVNKLEESIEAYKESLRNNPNDMETKYNLAFALDKLKKQQNQQNQQNQKQQQNKEQEQQKQQQQDQQQKSISKENAERILEALQNDEKELQEKLKKEKAKAQKASTGKNW